MFASMALTHLIFWPQTDDASLLLVDRNGEEVGKMPVTEPVRGVDLQRLLPAQFNIAPFGCTAVSLSGNVICGGKGAFDSAVVVERDRPTVEDRLAIIERREKYRQREFEKQQAAIAAARNELAEREQKEREEREKLEQVVEEPETPSRKRGEAVSEAETASKGEDPRGD